MTRYVYKRIRQYNKYFKLMEIKYGVDWEFKYLIPNYETNGLFLQYCIERIRRQRKIWKSNDARCIND